MYEHVPAPKQLDGGGALLGLLGILLQKDVHITALEIFSLNEPIGELLEMHVF